MSKGDRGNENFNPNILLILLVILYAYSQETIEFYDGETSNNNYSGKSIRIKHKYCVLSKEHDLSEEDCSNFKKSNEEGSDSSAASGKRNSLKDYSKEHNDADFKEANNRSVVNSDEVNDCSIANSEIVPEYPNKLIMLDDDCNHIIVNVPVVLSQFEIEFDCETIIKLDYPAIDIKRTKKNVFLDECRLLPKVNKLFLSGLIRKNIEYGAEKNIKHMTMEVPFKCITEVQYFTPPVIKAGDEQIEIETIRADGMGANLYEKTYISSEYFNEKIYCMLVSDEISELLIADEDKNEFESPEWERWFETLTEKMVVKLNLKLLQEQQINFVK